MSMIFNNRFFKLIVYLSCCLLLISCGKVVQQTAESQTDNNFFTLTYKTDQLYVMPYQFSSSVLVTKNTVLLPRLAGMDYKQFSNNTVWLSKYFKNKNFYEVIVKHDKYYSALVKDTHINAKNKDITQDSFLYNSKDPVYSLVNGYKKQKAFELAWGYSLFQKKASQVNRAQLNPNYEAVNNKYVLNVDSFDKDKIKITAAKKTQITVDRANNSNDLTFTTKQVSRDYDYYLVAIYANESDYQMKVFSNEVVSKNKTLNLEKISQLDTFRSLIFIQAFRSNSIDLDVYNGLNQLFDQQFFNSLQYSFGSFDLKLFNKKKPQFKYVDTLISECVFILELAFIDKQEAIDYVTQNEKKLLKKSQQDLLISSIKMMKTANVE